MKINPFYLSGVPIKTAGIATLFFLVAMTAPVVAGLIQPVGIADAPALPPTGGSSDSLNPVISPDGRYVLFASSAKNLSLSDSISPAPTSIPAPVNVYLRDRLFQKTTLVSVSLDGNGAGNGDSFPAGISTNGQFALFESTANNLVGGDTNRVNDVFIRDLSANVTTLVSSSTNNGPANGSSRSPVMTPDGRFIAFVSAASNLSPDDTNGIPDIFVRDLQGGTRWLAGAVAMPASASSSSELPLITPDGRFFSFYSTATNLIPGITNSGEIYLADLQLGTTVWASTNARSIMNTLVTNTYNLSCNQAMSADGRYVAYEASPLVGNGLALRFDSTTGLTSLIGANIAGILPGLELNSRNLSMTPDGRFIAFTSGASDINNYDSLYVWDALGNSTSLVSLDRAQLPVTNAIFTWPSLTPDGSFISFLSSATNLTANSITAGFHLYVRNLLTGTNVLVDADPSGVGSTSNLMTFPCLSDNGNLVTFDSPDGKLVAGDNNRAFDVFTRNLATASTELVSTGLPGLPSLTPNASSLFSASCVSTNGRFIAFWSEADNLTLGNTNGRRNVFVRDLLAGSNILASVNTNGNSGNGPSTDAALSGDGHFVSFTSFATNLFINDNNSASDIFLRDLQSGQTSLVSLNTSQSGPGNAASYSSTVSRDGRYVLFFSTASDLVLGYSGSANGSLYWRDMLSGTNRAPAFFASGTINTTNGAMTPDGLTVALSTRNSSTSKFYVWDAASDRTTYTNTTASIIYSVAISPDASLALYYTPGQVVLIQLATKTQVLVSNANSRAGCQFSADGRWLAYVAGTNQIYRYDVMTGSNLLVSAGANGACDSPAINASGRFVAYRSLASNLVPDDTNGLADIFLYDADTGRTTLVSAAPLGNLSANGSSANPVFSADGQSLFWQSWADNLSAQDFDQWPDLFVMRSFATNSPGNGQPFGISAFDISSLAGLGSSGQAATLAWPAGAGNNFQVLYTDDLNPPVWHNLSGSPRTIGTQTYLQDAATNHLQRFYRVVAY